VGVSATVRVLEGGRDEKRTGKGARLPGADARGEFLRYPDNRLGEPKLAFEDTTDLRAVVREHFGVK